MVSFVSRTAAITASTAHESVRPFQMSRWSRWWAALGSN